MPVPGVCDDPRHVLGSFHHIFHVFFTLFSLFFQQYGLIMTMNFGKELSVANMDINEQMTYISGYGGNCV